MNEQSCGGASRQGRGTEKSYTAEVHAGCLPPSSLGLSSWPHRSVLARWLRERGPCAPPSRARLRIDDDARRDARSEGDITRTRTSEVSKEVSLLTYLYLCTAPRHASACVHRRRAARGERRRRRYVRNMRREPPTPPTPPTPTPLSALCCCSPPCPAAAVYVSHHAPAHSPRRRAPPRRRRHRAAARRRHRPPPRLS